MARRKKGREVHGWLIVDKPAGLTSTAVVNKLRYLLNAKKAGHAGTLDPAATGMLAVAFGEATKTIPFVTDALKSYRFTVRFGAATNTDDAEGEVIATSDSRPTDAEIKAGLKAFEGETLQIPPKFSAIKIDGERAYALARDGEDFEIAARPLWVESIELIARPDADHAEIEMVCGKGGYVRSVARDLGEALGCLGHVTALRRIWSGPFDLEDGGPYAGFVENPETIEARLLPLEAALTDIPQVVCSAEAAVRLSNGNPAPVIASAAEYGEIAWAAQEGRPIAIGTYRAGELHPSRVFNL